MSYSNFVPKTHRFWDIRLPKCRDLENLVWGPSRSLKMAPFDRAHNFLLTIRSNHGLSRSVSEIDGDFSRKSQNFPTPLYFAPHWNWISALGVKKLESWCYRGRVNSLTISSAVWIQYTNVTDRRTDGQTDRHRATAKTALTHNVARWKLSLETSRDRDLSFENYIAGICDLCREKWDP